MYPGSSGTLKKQQWSSFYSLTSLINCKIHYWGTQSKSPPCSPTGPRLGMDPVPAGWAQGSAQGIHPWTRAGNVLALKLMKQKGSRWFVCCSFHPETSVILFFCWSLGSVHSCCPAGCPAPSQWDLGTAGAVFAVRKHQGASSASFPAPCSLSKQWNQDSSFSPWQWTSRTWKENIL